MLSFRFNLRNEVELISASLVVHLTANTLRRGADMFICLYKFYRSVDCWNSLPPELKQANSLNPFKQKLLTVDFSKFFMGSAFDILLISQLFSIVRSLH